MDRQSWSFFRAGGVDQVNLTRGSELVALGQLDQKLWVALACPVDGLEFDTRTLALIDQDGDRRIRASELIAATTWMGGLLADVEQLSNPGPELPLSALNQKNADGAQIHTTARALLSSLGKASATSISVDDVAAAIDAFNKQPYNGDGVITPASATDDATRQAITDALACTAAPPKDRGGDPGLDAAAIAAFFEALAAYVAWLDAGPAARALGAGTDAAWAAWSAVSAKVDDYYARVRVAGWDPRALAAMNADEAAFAAAAKGLLSGNVSELRGLALAIVGPGQALPLKTGLNPAWSGEIAALLSAAVVPLLGDRDALTQAEWAELSARLAPFGAWLGAKAGASVEALGEARARALLASDLQARLGALVARDAELAPQAAALGMVEKALLYKRDLMTLANNFVSFRAFYGRKGLAIFQAGTLYLDQRACELTFAVNNAGKHAGLAPMSKAYLVYCDLRNAAGQTRSVVAAMTDGDTDNLMVGRNGVFYDRQGKDWDATVSRIVEAPISVRQAFWAPYKKLVRLVEDQINSRAAASAAAADARVGGAATSIETAAAGKPEAPEAPKKLDVGVVAALGVAVGGITAALGALLGAFFGLGLWMPLGVLALLMLISGPSMALAWLKLRQRNLGPLLDANGWAVNALTRVNVPLGKSFTTVAALPEGAQRDLADPFAEKKKPWWLWLTLLVLLGLAGGWYLGKLDSYLPLAARSVTVLGEAAPAHVVIPPSEPPAGEAAPPAP